MNLRTILILVTVLFSIIAIIITHQLYTPNTRNNSPRNEAININNTTTAQIMKDYNGSGINYAAIMIEKEAMARNRHVIRLCNS